MIWNSERKSLAHWLDPRNEFKYKKDKKKMVQK